MLSVHFFFLLYLYHEMEKYGMREKFRITLWVSLPCCLCHSEDQAVNQNFQKMEELKITEKTRRQIDKLAERDFQSVTEQNEIFAAPQATQEI